MNMPILTWCRWLLEWYQLLRMHGQQIWWRQALRECLCIGLRWKIGNGKWEPQWSGSRNYQAHLVGRILGDTQSDCLTVWGSWAKIDQRHDICLTNDIWSLIPTSPALHGNTCDNMGNNNTTCKTIEDIHTHQGLEWNSKEQQLPYAPHVHAAILFYWWIFFIDA